MRWHCALRSTNILELLREQMKHQHQPGYCTPKVTTEPIIDRCTDIIDDEDCDHDDNDNDNDGYDDDFPTMPISQSVTSFSLLTR